MYGLGTEGRSYKRPKNINFNINQIHKMVKLWCDKILQTRMLGSYAYENILKTTGKPIKWIIYFSPVFSIVYFYFLFDKKASLNIVEQKLNSI